MLSFRESSPNYQVIGNVTGLGNRAPSLQRFRESGSLGKFRSNRAESGGASRPGLERPP